MTPKITFSLGYPKPTLHRKVHFVFFGHFSTPRKTNTMIVKKIDEFRRPFAEKNLAIFRIFDCLIF